MIVSVIIRRISETRPKSDGHGHGYKFLPVGTGAGGYWYQPRIWLRTDICNIRSESDPLTSLVAWMWEKGCGPLDAKSESSVASFLFSRKETLVVAFSPFCPFLAATPFPPQTWPPLPLTLGWPPLFSHGSRSPLLPPP
jgi:hypothetical protein